MKTQDQKLREIAEQLYRAYRALGELDLSVAELNQIQQPVGIAYDAVCKAANDAARQAARKQG